MPRYRSRSKELKAEKRDSHHDDYRKRKSYESGQEHRRNSEDSKYITRKDKHNKRSVSKSPSPKVQINPDKKKELNEIKIVPEEEDDQDSRTIFVWQLSKKIRHSDLKEFFSRAGALKDVRLIKDQRTNRPKGIAYVEFCKVESVTKALTYAGSRLLGVPIQINQVMDKPDISDGASGLLDNDYADRGGVGLGNTGRLALMAKLAEGTGLELPKPALEIMKSSMGNHNFAVSDIVNMKRQVPLASECFVLGNMFENHPKNGKSQLDASFFQELKEDVEEECSRHGKVLNVFIDRRGPGGNVYTKCANVEDAKKCVNVMHGRYFSGRIVTANFITMSTFHQMLLSSNSGIK